MRKLIIVSVLIVFVFLSGCTFKRTPVDNSTADPGRFTEIRHTESIWEIVDHKTGQHYLYVSKGYGGGLVCMEEVLDDA